MREIFYNRGFITLENENITIEFDNEKLKSLRFFMKDKELKEVLEQYVDKLYQKNVPTQVREYVEQCINNTEAETISVRQRRPRRQRETEQVQENVQQPTEMEINI